MDAGHEVRLLGDAATLSSAQALAVPTTALARDIRGALHDDQARILGERMRAENGVSNAVVTLESIVAS